jgi:hypothetical protein
LTFGVDIPTPRSRDDDLLGKPQELASSQPIAPCFLGFVPGDVRSALLTKHRQAKHLVMHGKALTATKNAVLPWCRA